MERIDTTTIKAEIQNAIAELIQLGFSAKVAEAIRDRLTPNERDQNATVSALKHITAQASQGHCLELSCMALYHLSQKYSSWFPKSVVIQIQPNSGQKNHMKYDWAYHAGLVMKDVLGNWHFISPANHDKSLLLTHFMSPALEQVLLQVEDQTLQQPSPQLMPTAAEIEDFLATHSTQIQRNQRQPFLIDVPVMTKFCGKVLTASTSVVIC